MALRYHLTGSFIECCNCKVICPCWVDDEPDEPFCAGLFAWTFDPGSVIEGHDVGGRSVVSVTVHGDRRRGDESQSAIYVDHAVPAEVARLLVLAFSGRGGGPLRDLAGVTGYVVDEAQAEVSVVKERRGWTVRVQADNSQLVRAAGAPKTFDDLVGELTLSHTALSKELGVGDEPVTAQRASVLQVDLAALPGAPIDVAGRSGMTGRFRYDGDGADEPDEPSEEPTEVGEEGDDD